MNARDYSSVAIAALVGLITGYFIGREHLKYELRSEIGVAKNHAQDIAERLSDKKANKPSTVGSPKISPIDATLISKSFKQADMKSHEYRDTVIFRVVFHNGSRKPIRAFDGVLSFDDLLGNEVLSANVKINEQIDVAALLEWDGELDFNPYKSSHRRFRDEDVQNLKAHFNVRKILFSDGVMKSFGGE